MGIVSPRLRNGLQAAQRLDFPQRAPKIPIQAPLIATDYPCHADMVGQ
ncbi:MAG: hypothetical protein OXU61_13835 [Gammaproteobacteria bacterium]|nr:hypothetical protein [Gammaproteobacteria bacterium]